MAVMRLKRKPFDLSGALRDLDKRLPAGAATKDLTHFRSDPAGYCHGELGKDLWAKQREILDGLLTPPYRVLALTGHGIGKSFTGAVAINWWYDTRDPSWVISTAPDARSLHDVLWTEVRLLRGNRPGWIGPQAPILRSGPNHQAKGYTANKGESFQGRHRPNQLFIFDEGIGVPPIYYETAKTMFRGDGQDAWLVFANPTDTASQLYKEARSGKWKIVHVSSLDHPNIALELAGQPPLHPEAVRLSQVEEWLHDWADTIPASEAEATDLEWPPHSGAFVRPGPLAECRCLGQWPSGNVRGVWSERLWRAAESSILAVPADRLPELGIDPARQGDDFTALHWRCGPTSLGHESHNGWEFKQTAHRAKQLCEQLAAWRIETNPDWKEACDPKKIPIKVDTDGAWGWGVIENLDGYCCVPVSAASAARSGNYKNLRTELWFNAANLARRGKLSLARLPRATLDKLHDQAMAPVWKVNGAGEAELEPKEDTKKNIGRSPDDMDGLNLAYLPSPETAASVLYSKSPLDADQESSADRAGLFGRALR